MEKSQYSILPLLSVQMEYMWSMEEAVECFKNELIVMTYSPPSMKTNIRPIFCARRNINCLSPGIGNMRIRMSEPTLKPAWEI